MHPCTQRRLSWGRSAGSARATGHKPSYTTAKVGSTSTARLMGARTSCPPLSPCQYAQPPCAFQRGLTIMRRSHSCRRGDVADRPHVGGGRRGNPMEPHRSWIKVPARRHVGPGGPGGQRRGRRMGPGRAERQPRHAERQETGSQHSAWPRPWPRSRRPALRACRLQSGSPLLRQIAGAAVDVSKPPCSATGALAGRPRDLYPSHCQAGLAAGARTHRRVTAATLRRETRHAMCVICPHLWHLRFRPSLPRRDRRYATPRLAIPVERVPRQRHAPSHHPDIRVLAAEMASILSAPGLPLGPVKPETTCQPCPSQCSATDSGSARAQRSPFGAAAMRLRPTL